MREFIVENKTYIKSNNSTTKIFNRYLYCLIPYILLIVVYSLIKNEPSNIIYLARSTSLSLFVSMTVQYIFNLIKKEKKLILTDTVVIVTIILFPEHNEIYYLV